jgi:hypothetical protein
MADDILVAAAEVYRERGPMHRGVPVASFLGRGDRAELEQRLGELLDSGVLVAHGKGNVCLSLGLRLALINRATLAQWLDNIAFVEGDLRDLVSAAIRQELRALAQWANVEGAADDLTQRAAELGGVLAMHNLDLTAMDIVSSYGATPRTRLRDVLSIKEGSCRSQKELRAAMSRFVSTTTVEA